MGHHDIELLLKQAQALAEDIQELESIDVAKGYGYTRQRIAQRKRQTLQTRLMRYVAFLSLPLLLTSLTLGYLLLTQAADEEHLVEVKASQGSVIRYELPDGSVVWLNAGSSLSHPAHFIHKERRVTLHGEAYFEVQADKDSPFYVQTSRGVEVYVYGTRFNVSTYEDDSQVSTLLEEGHLCVNLPNDTTPHELRPGECKQEPIYAPASDAVYTLEELYGLLKDTLEQMPENHRTVFVKTFLETKTQTEVAEEMQISVKSVHRYKQKAIEQLRNVLKDYLPLALLLMAHFKNRHPL